MPLVRFDVVKGRSAEQVQSLLDAAHDTLVEAFSIPRTDRYQIVSAHEPSEVCALDTGLGFRRSSDLVVIQVTTRPRTVVEKQNFYSLLTRALSERCGIDPADVIVTCVENTDADWSFGNGEAQFLTGALPTKPLTNDDDVETSSQPWGIQ